MTTLAPSFPAFSWTGWWSRLVNHGRLLGRPRHRGKVKRSRALLLKIADIAAQENGHARAFGYLRKVDPYLFEELTLSAIEQASVRVVRNRSYSGDGGVDGELVYRGRRVLIQAKRYGSHIARAHVAAFGQVCQAQGAGAGLFVHTGRTGEGVRTLLKEPGAAPVVIVSGSRFISFLTQPAEVRRVLDALEVFPC